MYHKILSLENLPNEIWVDIVGYEKIYQVSKYVGLTGIILKLLMGLNGQPMNYAKGFLMNSGSQLSPQWDFMVHFILNFGQ